MLSSEGLIRVKTMAAAALLAAAVAAGVLALVGTKPAEAAFPGANGKIAFASDRSTGTGVNNPTADKEIFAMNPDRTGLEQLTDNTANEFDPAWSANGGAIAYRSDRDSVSGEIYTQRYSVLPFNPTTRLTNNTASDSEPAFNHDGTKIAFTSTRDGNNEIYVMDTKDEINNQTGDPEPDGNGDNLKRLTNDPASAPASDNEPAWSPDGTKIAFTSTRDGNPNIYVMNADGTEPKRLTNNLALDGDPNWSPDGTKIAFMSTRDGNNEIYKMNADGTEQKRLTKKVAADLNPVFSPDGKKIAFEGHRESDPEIYVMKAKPESRKKNRPKNLTRNDVSDSQPDWRPIPQP